jgi:putative PIN family toxin of toxin-antitoxin system
MRVLLDTNVVVSALLFGGPPRGLLCLLRNYPFELWTSRPLLRELAATLSHEKLAPAMGQTGLAVETLVQAYASQTFVVADAALKPVEVPPDPSDEIVLAAAHAADADWLVTGDRHLLDAREMIAPTLLTVAEALVRTRQLLSGPTPPGTRA